MTELQIRLIFVGVFLASILIGLYYVLQTNAFGEINDKVMEQLKDILNKTQDLNSMLNGTTNNNHNKTIVINPTPKICGFLDLPKPGIYMGAERYWCFTV